MQHFGVGAGFGLSLGFHLLPEAARGTTPHLTTHTHTKYDILQSLTIYNNYRQEIWAVACLCHVFTSSHCNPLVSNHWTGKAGKEGMKFE